MRMTKGTTESHLERVPLSRGEYVLILLFWTFYAALAAAGALLDPRGRFGQSELQLGQIVFPVVQSYLWAALTPLIFWLVAGVTMPRHSQARRVLLLLAAGILTALCVDVVLAYFRFELMPPPVGRRFNALRFGPLEGIRRLWFLDDFVMYGGVVAAGLAREYSLRLRLRQEESVRLQAEAARLSSQLAESRLAALRTQLDPHFLFNTLHAVSALVTHDPRGVRRMISLLSELLRRSLEGARAPEVPLSEELDFVGRYLEIMQIRFQGKLEVSTRTSPGALEGLVPTLVLQPLVENAVKHGMGDAAEAGRIEIEAHRQGTELVLAVEDSGPGPSGALTEGLGIRNTRERLLALYGTAQSLTLGAGHAGGFRAEVRLPYHTAADLRASSPESVG
jgi:hypothetical protein